MAFNVLLTQQNLFIFSMWDLNFTILPLQLLFSHYNLPILISVHTCMMRKQIKICYI